MEIVIIDCRNGGTIVTPSAQEAIDMSDVVLCIEQDNLVRTADGGRWVRNEKEAGEYRAMIFQAETEAEDSARRAAEHIAGRVGKPRSEHNNHAAMRKATAVWDMMTPRPRPNETDRDF